MKTTTLCIAWLMGCLGPIVAGEKQAPSADIIEMGEFTTSVKRQLEKEDILQAYSAARKVTVQLVWSDQDAAPEAEISEERIQSRSSKLELDSTQRSLLLNALREDSDYGESIASCLCEFQPQLRVVFHSGKPEVRYDILVSGISHGEVQAFRNGHLKAYARTSHFIPALLGFLAVTFPNHELTKMLIEVQKLRKKAANQSPEPTAPSGRGSS
jgi:hypothetical protein